MIYTYLVLGFLTTIILGGDGRFLSEQAINAIIKISAANGVCFSFFHLLLLIDTQFLLVTNK